MKQRLDIEQQLPEVWKAMYSLSGSVNKTSLTPIQKHLIKLRASQINSCAYCIDMHTREALQDGETLKRIVLLSAWRETDLFTDEEKAMLAVVEEVTLIHQKGVSDETYNHATQFFSHDLIAQITMATVVINAWSRIALSSQLLVPRD